MPENSSSVTESLKAGNRVVAFGIAAIVLIAGLWTVMTWAQTLAEVARVRLG